MTDAQGYRPSISDPAADFLAQKASALDMMQTYKDEVAGQPDTDERFHHNERAIEKIRARARRLCERSAMRQIMLDGWYA